MEHFTERARRVSQAALSIQTGSHLILGLGTVWAAWQGASGYLSVYLEGFLLYLTCALFSFLAYKVLDGGMKTTVPFVVAYFVGSERAEKKALPIYFIGGAVILAFFQLGLSVWGNLIIAPDLAATVVAPADDVTPAALDDVTVTYETDRQALVDVVSEKKKALAALTAERETEKINAVPAAIRAGAQSGNTWAQSKQREYKNAIHRRYQRRITAAEEDLRAAENNLTAFVNRRGDAVTEARTKAVEQSIEESAAADAKVMAWADFFRALMLVALVLFLAATFLICAYEDAYCEKVLPELTAGAVAAKAWNSVTGLALKRADNAIEQKLVEAAPPPPPARKVAPSGVPEFLRVEALPAPPPAPAPVVEFVAPPLKEVKAVKRIEILTNDEAKQLIAKARARARYWGGNDALVTKMLTQLRENGYTAQVDENDSKRLKISKP